MVDFSSPFQGVIAANAAPPQNPLLVANQMAQTRTALAGADNAELARAQNHLDYITSAITPVLLKGDNVTLGDVASAGAKAIADSNGQITSDEITHFVTGLPDRGPALNAALQQHFMRVQDANSRLNTLRGQPFAVDTGGQTQFGTRNSFTGTPTIQGSVRNTLAPASAAAMQPSSVDPNTGAQTMQPAGLTAEQYGMAPTGTYTGQGGSAAPTRVTVGRNGAIMRGPAAPAAQDGTAPQFGAPMGSADRIPVGPAPTDGGSTRMGPTTTTVGPGTQQAYRASGDQYAGALANAGTYAQQQTQLASALSGLQNANTGPGTEARQQIASFMLALPGGVGQYLPGVDAESIKQYDEARKYLTQTAAGTPNAGRSDAGLDTALAASPSVHISNAAAQDVLKANIGFRRGEQATVNAFKQSGLPPEQFASWAAQRQQGIDPRVYSVDLLPQAQRTAFMKTLTPDARVKFLATVRDGMRNGVISPGALGGAASAGGSSGGQ